MDACDHVMDKIGRPEGLIRYASYNSIKEGFSKLINARVIAYGAVLILLLSLTSFLLMTRSDISASVKRAAGMTYQRTEDDRLSNIYNVKIINKTFEEIELSLEVSGVEGIDVEQIAGETIVIPPDGLFEGIFRVTVPDENVKAGNDITFTFLRDGEELDKSSTNFMGPLPGAKR